jgi:Amt family ammonium transporter
MTTFGRLAACAGAVLLFTALMWPSAARAQATLPAAVDAAVAAATQPAGAAVPASQPTAEATTQPAAAAAEAASVPDTIWTLICGMLVFWMNAGFACVESGLCRRKNAVNILAKNFIVFAISSIAFWMFGCGLMFGDGNGFIGLTGFFPSMLVDGSIDVAKWTGFASLDWTKVAPPVKFFFQLVFAGTAATIVSGAVAERIKLIDFMIFSFLLVAFVYPITGHWIWGGGWLSTFEVGGEAVPFHDFAGSTVVHSVGGWAALAGVILLGPRIGKYGADGKVTPIPGHNMGLAALGCLILWLGWFGFNPGSTMTANVAAGYIAVTTNMAAATGSIAACAVAWVVLGKPDLGMILNGCLAGLVAITAPCAVVDVWAAGLIGLIAGGASVLCVLMFDKLRLDDPVGALSVHLVGGVFGTLCVGIFANPAIIKVTASTCQPGLFYGGSKQIVTQLVGIGAVGGYTLVASLIFWAALKYTLGIRVSADEEVEGLDIGEHGMEAYAGFATDSIAEASMVTKSGHAPKGVVTTA